MESINGTLGTRLREIRTAQKMTREALAEKADVSSRFLADVEAGKVGVSLSTLKNLCVILNVSADFLLGLERYPNSENEYIIGTITKTLARLDADDLKNLQCIISAFEASVIK